MAKPFRVDTTPRMTDIGRLPDGKFTRIVPPAPPQVVRRSSDTGTDIQDVIDDVRAPMHPTPKGAPDGAEIPWGPAGPYNDAAKPPMKLDR